MSHHKKYKKYSKKYAPSAPAGLPAPEQFVLEVLRLAEQAGTKAGYKSVKKALKAAAQHDRELSPEQIEELYSAAERAGASAGLLAARKMLATQVHRIHPVSTNEPAVSPTSAVDPHQAHRDLPVASMDPQPGIAGPLRGMGQHVLRIKRLERLSPEMLRIVAGAPKLAGFRPNSKADQYVKLYYADPALGLVAPYDLKALRQELPRHQMPRSRSYTIRWVDETVEELAIDFVLHQDPGSAGAWAAAAKIGDPMVISGAHGKFTPHPNAPYFVFAADEAGIPAICSALAQLPPDAMGVALLEVAGAQSEFEVPHPQGIEIHWLHREGAAPGTTNLLPMALDVLPEPPRHSAVMAHAERGASKAMSEIVSRWNLDKKSVHISSYWTLRRAKSRH